jgi:hypothetical protein
MTLVSEQALAVMEAAARLKVGEEVQDGTRGTYLKDKKGGDMAEWPARLRVRQFPEVRHG